MFPYRIHNAPFTYKDAVTWILLHKNQFFQHGSNITDSG